MRGFVGARYTSLIVLREARGCRDGAVSAKVQADRSGYNYRQITCDLGFFNLRQFIIVNADTQRVKTKLT